jgi:hypothetical protein
MVAIIELIAAVPLGLELHVYNISCLVKLLRTGILAKCEPAIRAPLQTEVIVDECWILKVFTLQHKVFEQRRALLILSLPRSFLFGSDHFDDLLCQGGQRSQKIDRFRQQTPPNASAAPDVPARYVLDAQPLPQLVVPLPGERDVRPVCKHHCNTGDAGGRE